jgi:hypothetical protein
MKQFTPMSARHYLQQLSIQKLFIALDCFRNSAPATKSLEPLTAWAYLELMELFLCNKPLTDCSPETFTSFSALLTQREITENDLFAELATAVHHVLEKYL